MQHRLMRFAMIARASRKLAIRAGLMLVALASIQPASAQQPSQAQISAIRGSCRADFQARCAGVQPGRADALACLKKNIAVLSPACQTAVGAVGGAAPQNSGAAVPAAPLPGSTAAAAPAAAGAMPARPPMPSRMQLAMLRQVCGADYRINCAGVPPGGGQVLACLAAHQATLSASCQRALVMAKGGM